MIKICHLYISPGHNFFGHHGKPPDAHPILERNTIECIAGRGVRGDRFFDFKKNYGGQITFISIEDFETACRQVGVTGKSPGLARRNVVTRGASLKELAGTEFEVQGVRFFGMVPCAPCYWMDKAVAPGMEAALYGRGGLRARILTDGILRVDLEAGVNEGAGA